LPRGILQRAHRAGEPEPDEHEQRQHHHRLVELSEGDRVHERLHRRSWPRMRADRPLRHPIERHQSVGALIALVDGKRR
jgi:hypothetical protein